ncbi:hypothetical protein [Actinomadura miaoliensis]|uniref:Uncharacterized protein n=1 Tax=Actinomadura miaoliensis TaxID=430685 RepID=A0ABP7W8Y0_9ACTN
MAAFVPNPTQALRLKVLAEDGSDFGEKLDTYQRFHDAAAETGEPCCPCLTCAPDERKLTS